MHVQLVQVQEHLENMKYIPTQILLIDGEEVEVENNTSLLSVLADWTDGDDWDRGGFLRNCALDVINTMLDKGHENFDVDFYDSVFEALAQWVWQPAV